MKTKTNKVILLALLLMAVLITPSCKKEEDDDEDAKTPPNLNFSTSAGFISASCTLSMNDTIHVGIDASKSEEEDPLTKFTITQKYDSGTETTIDDETFSQDAFAKDVTIITRGVAGTETYKFTIFNRDGLTTTKTLVFTVL